ncbi:MAG: ABC transporter ATP-binding protein, partial [Sedimentisphaerales bacterium]
MQNNILLEVKNLSTHFLTQQGTARVVQNVSFAIEKGKTFALVGESGCGKSVTALSIMRLVPEPQGKIVCGEVIFVGQNLLTLSEKKMRQIRGNKIAMVFQEPMTSLNPVFTVGNQIAESIRLHQRKNNRAAWAETIKTLKKVGIDNPDKRAKMYPHQLSGGMQQRVMIAMAVSCEPALLIADEPTTALDVTIQAQILNLLDELQKQNGMSILLITHDLAVVAERAEDVAVMYASRIVEIADTKQLFSQPYHPYTKALLQSLPRLSVTAKRLPTIPGEVPEPLRFPAGCKFHPRCPVGHADKRCQTVEPELRQ